MAFSCNIWNIEATRIIGQRLKALLPETTIILGGPEVWYEPLAAMQADPWIDFIISGEGELAFKEWLRQFCQSKPDWGQVSGLAYRTADGVKLNERGPDIDLNQLPFPFPDDLTPFRQKLVYYETARGCPNRCQYCLSANEPGVRFLALDRVKQELLRFIAAEIIQVKLVDRSFNCNPGRAKEIWRFLIAHPGKTNFHFELVGELLDDESLAIIKTAPPGLFQFEIGVQSTNPETLKLIQRQTDLNRLGTQVAKLVQNGNVHVHLDLIAGLPAEDYTSFAKSFNDTLALKPDRLQMGFLKLLKGSGIRNQAAGIWLHLYQGDSL